MKFFELFDITVKDAFMFKLIIFEPGFVYFNHIQSKIIKLILN